MSKNLEDLNKLNEDDYKGLRLQDIIVSKDGLIKVYRVNPNIVRIDIKTEKG